MIHAKKREGLALASLVREVTCTSFRWKGTVQVLGGGRVIIVRGPVTCLWVVLAVPIISAGHRYSHRRVAIAALQ